MDSALNCRSKEFGGLELIVGVSNGQCETLRDGETDTFSASPRLP